MRRTVDILGTRVDVLTMEEAVRLGVQWMEGQRTRPAHVVTANPEMVMAARKDASLASVLDRADMVVADGTGVVWASRLLRRALPHRIAGIDLTARLLAEAARRDMGVYLLGARPGVADEAAERLRRVQRGLRIVGTHHGFFSRSDEKEIVERINASGASLLLVAMGVPRQEFWIARHRETLRVNVAIGVGGALDVFAGRAKRAPKWVQGLGLEWAYRLLREPRRVGRMAALPKFVVQTVKAALVDRGRI